MEKLMDKFVSLYWMGFLQGMISGALIVLLILVYRGKQ